MLSGAGTLCRVEPLPPQERDPGKARGMEMVQSALLPGQTGSSGGGEALDGGSAWPLWENVERGTSGAGGIPGGWVGQGHLGGLLPAEGSSVSGGRAVHRTGEAERRGIGQGSTSEPGHY